MKRVGPLYYIFVEAMTIYGHYRYTIGVIRCAICFILFLLWFMYMDKN